MGNLIKFFIVWYSQNMAIPFWVVGHIHLNMNVYDDWKEYGASIVMHLMVLVGFIIDYNENKKKPSK
jgi:hypothetical protein